MPLFFCRADAMLMTLKKTLIFSLTVPAKLQTYMACGRPILTMLDGEGSKIVEDAGAGLVAGAGDSGKLAENVKLIPIRLEGRPTIRKRRYVESDSRSIGQLRKLFEVAHINDTPLSDSEVQDINGEIELRAGKADVVVVCDFEKLVRIEPFGNRWPR